jgi:hypothetical protein
MPSVSSPQYPKNIDVRKEVAGKISNIYYPTEFVWKLHWYPKLPKRLECVNH